MKLATKVPITSQALVNLDMPFADTAFRSPRQALSYLLSEDTEVSLWYIFFLILSVGYEYDFDVGLMFTASGMVPHRGWCEGSPCSSTLGRWQNFWSYFR